ncbi:MAG: sulfotransferase [Sphingobium sp.]
MTTAYAPPPSAARNALTRGDFAAVRDLASRMMARDPQDAEGYFLFGLAESQVGRIAAGIAHLGDAVKLDPKGEYRAQLARLQIMGRQDGEAAATLQAAEAVPPADALSRDTMGCVYARLGDHERALPHFEEAVRLVPESSSYRYNLATTLNFLGRTIDAEAALEALLAIAPNEARAHHLLSALRKQTRADNHIDRLTRSTARATDGRDRLLLGYALAKELEDIGEPDAALDKLHAANAAHRRTLPYSFARDAALFDAVEAAWPLAPARGAVDERPIFIIGMPRTGTTLVDRILSSHPLVESAGELQAMPLAVKKAAGTRTPMVMDAQTIAAAASADPAAIGRDYLDRAAHHRRDPRLRFIDKFPGNFFYAGFIAQALPAARIVCLRRSPMDTVLSNFRNLFAVGSRYYDYSYDLRDIATYYIRFNRLMTLWRERLGERLIEVRYEDIVADQEGQSRRMLAHCGLDWSDDCLSFHANNAPVSTPSAAQVRRPIYADSVGRWKRHAALLEPVRRMFEQAAIAIS